MDAHATHDPHHHDGRRVEDQRLITGAGKYAADWNVPGQLYGYFVRSDHAHAEIVSVNTTKALAHPGVKQVYTGDDAVAAGYVRAAHVLAAPGRNGMKARALDRPVLAHGKVRFVGEAVALVVADSAGVAADAAELVEVEYRELQPIVNPEQALAPGAPQLDVAVPGNLVYESEAGNEAATDAAIKSAAHVTRLRVDSTRVTPCPMEPRACLVQYDPATGEYRFNLCTQGITTLRKMMSSWTKVAEDKLIFEAHDVGGGFGQRTPAYPEYIALMIAAKALVLADWSGFAARRAQSAKAGKLRGLGISTVIEASGAGNAPKDEVEMQLDASGTVTLYTVSKAQGHGHETTLGAIVATALGIALEKVKVVQCAPGSKLEGKFGSTFPNGCHITEVEIDKETGAPQIVSYCAVDDCGVIINHAIVEGQLHGGVVQGAGQVFGEQVVYDQKSGQPLSASFMDYIMPRAGLVPELRGEEHATTSKVSPLGVKGVGESGCTASIPSLVSAVLDAVRPVGVKHLDMPMTPSRIWRAMQAVKR